MPENIKNMKHEGDGDTDCNRRPRNNLQRIGTGIERIRNNSISGDHPYNSIIKIGRNNEESPGD